jgi:peptidyl-prolyl cis-trans isomerase D
MLQNIRQNIKGTAAKIIVGLIVLSFSIFGIESILLGGSGNEIAEVNGEGIYPDQVQQMVNTERRRIIQQQGDNLDPAMLDEQRLGARAVQSLISRKLQMQSAGDMNLMAAEKQLGAVIGAMEQFHIDGQFSPDMYKSMLSNAGFTPQSFKTGLSEDLVLNQVRSGLAGSDFATAAELSLNAQITRETRDVRYMTIPLEAFISAMAISDTQIEAYYEQRGATFLTEESVELDFIELALSDYMRAVEEEELLESYEAEKDGYAYATENRVSHILFTAGSDENETALRARAAAVVEALATGGDFAELAASSSDDLGSSSLGGDLGFSSGDAFPPEMEEAIAGLEAGEVSALVETDAGLHLIKLTERRAGSMPSLEELRPELEQRLATDAASVELLRTVESLKDYAFNAENLDEPASELNLTVQKSEMITRSGSDGLFSRSSLLTAAFSEEVLEAGHNSEVIDLGSNRFVVLRLRQHHPAEIKSLAMVRNEIVASMTAEAARIRVSEEANRAIQALASGQDIETFANQNGYQWQVELAADRRNQLVPPRVLQRAFDISGPSGEQSVFDYVITPIGDAQVLELVRVTAGDYKQLAETAKAALSQQIGGEYGALIDIEYRNGLRTKADITVI